MYALEISFLLRLKLHGFESSNRGRRLKLVFVVVQIKLATNERHREQYPSIEPTILKYTTGHIPLHRVNDRALHGA